MDFKFLEDMGNDDDDIEIQYHPDDEEEALKLKDFIEFQIQTIDVIDKYYHEIKIRYAMIYAIQYQDEKVILYGKDHIYTCHYTWDKILELFHGSYFASIQEHLLVNCYHVKEIDNQKRQIVLENNQLLVVGDITELAQYKQVGVK